MRERKNGWTIDYIVKIVNVYVPGAVPGSSLEKHFMLLEGLAKTTSNQVYFLMCPGPSCKHPTPSSLGYLSTQSCI